jgi:hypothetical protein
LQLSVAPTNVPSSSVWRISSIKIFWIRHKGPYSPVLWVVWYHSFVVLVNSEEIINLNGNLSNPRHCRIRIRPNSRKEILPCLSLYHPQLTMLLLQFELYEL